MKKFDPAQQLKTTYGLIFFIGTVNIGVGILTSLFHIDVLHRLGLNPSIILIGIIYVILGNFVRQKSMAALIVVIGLFILDSIFSMKSVYEKMATLPTGTLILRIFFLAILIQGLKAIKKLRPSSQI